MTVGATSPASADRTITVPGRGSVRVEPDVADLRLGVVSIRPTAAAARSAAAETMQAILAALLAAGIDRRDLRTALVGLDAVRDYSSPTPTVTGYQMTNTVEATVRAIETVGGAIDAALAAGATSMDGLSFRVSDPTAALGDARRLAVADARARATTLAEEAGVKLGERRRDRRRGRDPARSAAPDGGVRDEGIGRCLDAGRGRHERADDLGDGDLRDRLIPRSTGQRAAVVTRRSVPPVRSVRYSSPSSSSPKALRLPSLFPTSTGD